MSDNDKKHDALQWRLEKELAHRAACTESAEREEARITEFLEEVPRYDDPIYLSRLLLCFVERIPEDLDLGGWESPSTEDHSQACLEMVDLCNRAWTAADHHGLVSKPDPSS